MRKIVYIYALFDPRYKRVRYVGKTINLRNRLYQHIYELNGSNPRKDNWIKGILKCGLKPEMIVIETCNQSNWKEREIFWIAFYREVYSDLLNILDGGECSWESPKVRDARVRKFARENNLEIKRCFICGGLTIANLEICRYCLETNFPGYEESDWYKYLVANDKHSQYQDRKDKRFIESSLDLGVY